MKKLLILFFLLLSTGILFAQDPADSMKKKEIKANADDPSQFITRIEVFNELQRYDKKNAYVNQSTLRSIFKIGKRFTTRIDLPYVYNSVKTAANYKAAGIGDISFRLLGYNVFQRPMSAITASIEISLNTAQSPILGTGKNLLIPVVTYSKIIPKKKMLLSLLFQQVNAVSGDKNRENVSFSKLQAVLIKYMTKRSWMVLAPEWFLDYVHGGLSMNLRSRFTYAPAPRVNIWVTPSAGIFGDFAGRYQWSLDIGARFFLLRGMNFNKSKSG